MMNKGEFVIVAKYGTYKIVTSETSSGAGQTDFTVAFDPNNGYLVSVDGIAVTKGHAALNSTTVRFTVGRALGEEVAISGFKYE